MLVALCRSRAIDARVPSVRAGGAGGFTGATSPTGPALGPRGPEFSRDLRRCPGRAKPAAQVASQEQPRRPDRRSSSTAQAAPKSPATDADVPIVPSRRRRWLHRSNLATGPALVIYGPRSRPSIRWPAARPEATREPACHHVDALTLVQVRLGASVASKRDAVADRRGSPNHGADLAENAGRHVIEAHILMTT